MATDVANADQIPVEGQEAKKAAPIPKKKKLMLFGAAAFVALMAAGGGAYFFMGKGAKQQAATAKKMVFFDLPEITTNLAMVPGQERPVYLKMKVALELEDQKMVAEIQPLMPRVMDNFQIFLRELRPSDLEGSAGLYRLKEELVRRINAAIYPARVEAILFKDVLVQ
jgi:flagellar FliL protein